MAPRFAAAVAVLAATSCAHLCPKPEPIRVVEPVRVEVPVPVQRAPPVELVAPLDPGDLPVFVVPSDPAATSALTPEGERRLRALLIVLTARVRAWEAWAAEPAAPPPVPR